MTFSLVCTAFFSLKLSKVYAKIGLLVVLVLLAKHLDIVLVVSPPRLDWLFRPFTLRFIEEARVLCPEAPFELISWVTSVWQVGWVCDVKAELDLGPPKPVVDLDHSTLLTH